jgi:hypothetical protein
MSKHGASGAIYRLTSYQDAWITPRALSITPPPASVRAPRRSEGTGRW